ncbi:tRNA-guanine transglycosylase DpdA [Haliangium sp. UPWRP_2]|uniref:tRNA-guanine transglycosylase DpdA n=1 Tax=Haliangium sp. UPWRP_2 TaxID=1931276 RepID=UPI0018EBCE5A|nr:tRNA-guanine transglycosylase DpdA [Haliangium sp. UPWRP_2]
MKYYLPDSQDHVDPSFDFETEKRDVLRRRQRDDLYAHEVLSTRSFDGLLVSKGIVDGFGDTGSRYTLAHRHRLLRTGAQSFFRIEECNWGALPVMGDCGAFTYVREEKPPYSVDDVIEFYLECGFNQGISVDHVIFQYDPTWEADESTPPEVRERQRITLDLADAFLKRCRAERVPFEPLGVAQGWGPRSYAHAVTELQRIGFDYIALGGMVPLKTREILSSLEAIAAVRKPNTRLHLLGISRTEHLRDFAGLGVYSFDSTSPLRQAFKDDKDNYYTLDRAYPAIRIPQVEGNAKLQKLISSGKVSQEKARALERACLAAMRRFDRDEVTVDEVVELLVAYERLCIEKASEQDRKRKKDYADVYREVLEARPWRACPCDVCRALGHHVILFRGAERNRRRGFHNINVFYRRLQNELGIGSVAIANNSGRGKTASAKRTHEERTTHSGH